MVIALLLLLIGLGLGWFIGQLMAKLRLGAGAEALLELPRVKEELSTVAADLKVESERARWAAEQLTAEKEKNAQLTRVQTELTAHLAAAENQCTLLTTRGDEQKSQLETLSADNLALQKNRITLENSLKRSEELTRQQEQIVAENNQLRTANQELTTDLAGKNATLESLRAERDELRRTRDEQLRKITEKNDEIVVLSRQLSEQAADNRNLNESLATQKKEIEEIRVRFQTEFQNIANRIIEDKAKSFAELSKNNIETLLKPLGENLDSFKKKVEETYDKEAQQRFSLKEEIARLAEQNVRISKEANNLAQALKGQAKTQGNWGEMILENILEKSGLVKGREYEVQQSVRDADGALRLYVDGWLQRQQAAGATLAYGPARKVCLGQQWNGGMRLSGRVTAFECGRGYPAGVPRAMTRDLLFGEVSP
jgi:DNA anti-recombination protein RmuC